MVPGPMEVPSWTNTDTIAICYYVKMFGCPADWGILGAALHKPAALCALRWHVLYLAHQPGKLVTGRKVWKDWELAVLLRGWAVLRNTNMTKSSIYQALTEWLPGRTTDAVKQAEKSYLGKKKDETEARLAGWPTTLLGVLEAWAGPELQDIQHTTLPDHVIAAQVLAELVHCDPACPSDGAQDLSASGSAAAAAPTMTEPYTYPPAPVSASAAQKGINSINDGVYASHLHYTGSPISETSTGALLTYPASRAGSSSSSAATYANFLGYEATQETMDLMTECNNSKGSPVSASGSALWDDTLPPYSVFSSSGFSSSGSASPSQADHTSNPGHDFWLPVEGAALDACGVELEQTAADHQPAAAFGVDILNANSHNSFSAASMAWHGYSLPVAGVDVGSMRIHLGTVSAQVHPVAPGNKSSLAAPSRKYTQPRAAAAAAVKSGNKAAKRRSKSIKQRHSKPQQRQVVLNTAPSRKRKASQDAGLAQTEATTAAPATTAAGQPRPTKRHHRRATQEQQQYLPMKFAGQYCLNQEQYIQLQGMQWAVTAAEYRDPFQVSTPAMDPEAFLCESLYSLTPTAAAAGDDTTQPPDWYMAGISLEGHGSSADPVQQVLDSPQLSECSTSTLLVTPDWSQVAMELDAAEEAFGTALQHIVPLDWSPEQTPGQRAGHQAALAAPAASGAAAAAASDAAILVQGQQPWQQQQQQGASSASAAGLAAQVEGCDILKWLADADLADAMQEDLEVHQAMTNAPPAAGDAANFVQGQQPWQQQQQGASYTFAAGLAAHSAAGDTCDRLTAADLAAVMCKVLAEPQEGLLHID